MNSTIAMVQGIQLHLQPFAWKLANILEVYYTHHCRLKVETGKALEEAFSQQLALVVLFSIETTGMCVSYTVPPFLFSPCFLQWHTAFSLLHCLTLPTHTSYSVLPKLLPILINWSSRLYFTLGGGWMDYRDLESEVVLEDSFRMGFMSCIGQMLTGTHYCW